MLFAGGVVYYLKGLPTRHGLEYLAQDYKREKTWLFQDCDINLNDNPESIIPCKVGDKSQTPSFIIIGDSHAPTYGKAIHNSAAINHVAGILSYSKWCPTLLDMITKPQVGDIACNQYNHMAFSYIKEHPEIKTVILASRWTIWVEGNRYKQEEGSNAQLEDTLNEVPSNTSEELLFRIGLERTVKAILGLGRKVVIVAPLPEIGYDVPSANFIASRTGRNINEIIAPSEEEFLARNQKTFSIFKSIEDKYGIKIIEPWKILCMEGKCRVAVNGIPLYNDDDHLSIFGSELLSPIFEPVFEPTKHSSK
jgi:hypothetical protein